MSITNPYILSIILNKYIVPPHHKFIRYIQSYTNTSPINADTNTSHINEQDTDWIPQSELSYTDSESDECEPSILNDSCLETPHQSPVSSRKKCPPVRFYNEKKHYHSSFGGSRLSNNSYTKGNIIDDATWSDTHMYLQNGEYSDCIGCESGSTCNHWHDPIPHNLSCFELEEWWEKQWYYYRPDNI